jgi:N-methylhydantoinase A
MDVRHDLETTFYAPVDGTDPAALTRAYVELESKVNSLLEADGVAPDEVEIERSAQMRYVGQSYEVNTPVGAGALHHSDLAEIARAFNAVHEREYGVASSAFAVAFVTLRVTGNGRGYKPTAEWFATALGDGAVGGGSIKQQRTAYFDGREHEVDVHDVNRLSADERIIGPAIIEQPDGVIVLPPGSVATADRYRNVTITQHDEEKAA